MMTGTNFFNSPINQQGITGIFQNNPVGIPAINNVASHTQKTIA